MVYTRHLLIALFVAIPIVLLSNTNSSYSISGQVSGAPEGIRVFLVKNKAEKGRGVDTLAITRIQQGHFDFSGSLVQEGFWGFIWLEGVPKKYVSVIMENTTITVQSSLTQWPEATISGSSSTTDYLLYQQKISPLHKAFNDLKMTRTQALKNNNGIAAKQVEDQMLAINNDLAKLKEDFINTHLGSYYTAFLLSGSSRLTVNERQNVYNKLTDRVKQSSLGQELKNEITLQVKQIDIVTNKKLPNFTSTTPEGKSMSVLDIVSQGKCTLIDFWASWCVPCREETPEIKKVYNAFHDKGFNVLSISFDEKAASWKTTITKDAMNWYHLSDLKGRSAEVHQLFALNGIPAYILVDGKGNILAMDLPGSSLTSDISKEEGILRKEKLYQKVEEALKTTD